MWPFIKCCGDSHRQTMQTFQMVRRRYLSIRNKSFVNLLYSCHTRHCSWLEGKGTAVLGWETSLCSVLLGVFDVQVLSLRLRNYFIINTPLACRVCLRVLPRGRVLLNPFTSAEWPFYLCREPTSSWHLINSFHLIRTGSSYFRCSPILLKNN